MVAGGSHRTVLCAVVFGELTVYCEPAQMSASERLTFPHVAALDCRVCIPVCESPRRSPPSPLIPLGITTSIAAAAATSILLFGVKYNEEQARAWLLAVLWAFLWDAGVFQPLAYGTRALLVALYTVSGCAQTELGEACNNLTYAIANVLG